MKAYLFLITSVALGSLIGYYLKKRSQGSTKFLLTLSGAYLLSIGVFHLLPEIYEDHDAYIGWWIMGGFFIQLVLEVFSRGIEHGHGHVEYFHNKGIPIGIMLSLFLHALLESLPIGAHAVGVSRDALMYGIAIHKLPVSIILFIMLSEMTKSLPRIIFWMLLFALIAPLGVFLGNNVPFLNEYYRQLTAITLGVFLHISTTILFESNKSHQFNTLKFLTTVLGVLLAWFTVASH